MNKFSFTQHSSIKNRLARAGTISTPHGKINTPAFITVGTAATVKSLTPEQVKSTGAQAVLANTYHLHLRPGEQVVAEGGGLASFMNWPGPTFTDSGGFQVFSLGAAFGKEISKIASGDDSSQSSSENRSSHAQKAVIDDQGVSFSSHLDGSPLRLTPEISMKIQHKLGADIIFAFDECTSPLADYEYQKQALERTTAWAKRCLNTHKELKKTDKNYIALFGVVQGGRHQDLRRQSARELVELDLDGFGIGGSFNKDDMASAVAWVCQELPASKPRHLLGIGEPIDLFNAIENGIDTFDCVSPTRVARNGAAYTSTGRINLTNAKYKKDFRPIDSKCRCYSCLSFSRAYISHLSRSGEMLGATLLSIHNLYFITNLVDRIRESIIDQSFFELKKNFLASYY